MSSKKELAVQNDEQKAFLVVKVQPRSAITCISDMLEDGTIRIKLNAPPVDGKANDALIRYLANFLGVRETSIEIRSGQTSKNKLIKINGLSQEYVLNFINSYLKR